MVLIEDDAVPIEAVNPLVLGLDAAGGSILAQVILERAEVDKRPRLVRLLIAQPVAAEKLPTGEVGMVFQIGLPRGLHGRFEGQNQHAPPAHALGQLVGGKGLAEAHLGVPQEVGRLVRLLLVEGLKVFGRLGHRLGLLRPHDEVERAILGLRSSLAQGQHRRPHLGHVALEPLPVGIADAPLPQLGMHVAVGEGRAVVAHGRLLQHDAVGRRPGFDDGILLGHPVADVDGGVTHLEQPVVLRIGVPVGVDFRLAYRPRGEELFTHR